MLRLERGAFGAVEEGRALTHHSEGDERWLERIRSRLLHLAEDKEGGVALEAGVFALEEGVFTLETGIGCLRTPTSL